MTNFHNLFVLESFFRAYYLNMASSGFHCFVFPSWKTTFYKLNASYLSVFHLLIRLVSSHKILYTNHRFRGKHTSEIWRQLLREWAIGWERISLNESNNLEEKINFYSGLRQFTTENTGFIILVNIITLRRVKLYTMILMYFYV